MGLKTSKNSPSFIFLIFGHFFYIGKTKNLIGRTKSLVGIFIFLIEKISNLVRKTTAPIRRMVTVIRSTNKLIRNYIPEVHLLILQIPHSKSVRAAVRMNVDFGGEGVEADGIGSLFAFGCGAPIESGFVFEIENVGGADVGALVSAELQV